MEFCELGSVKDFSEYISTQFDEPQICFILYHTLLGLRYLHELSPPIVHRDIKSSNILLTTTGGVKLADFGVASPIPLGQLNETAGTLFYM